MSRRRELLQHLDRLGEIRAILNAMKNLALLETRKLARFLDSQQQAVAAIETAAADFLGFYPHLQPISGHTQVVLLIVGSERGFCGDFNDALIAELEADQSSEGQGILIGMGVKLCDRLSNVTPLAASLNAASVAEDVPAVLNQLIVTLNELQQRYGVVTLSVIYHDLEEGTIKRQPLLPPFQSPPASCLPYPPVLNLPPEKLLADLIEQYLFAALPRIFYASLMAENHRRVEHMEAATAHLDSSAEALTRKSRSLRQEEITEEIEVILLSTESLLPKRFSI